MKKAMFVAAFVAASVILYAILDVSCFFIFYLKPYSGWSLVTSLVLTSYTLFAMRYIHKKAAFPWWGTWLCVVPCGTVLMMVVLLLIQPLASSVPFYGAASLLFIFWGGAVQNIVWIAVAVIAGCMFLYRYLKKIDGIQR